MTDATKSLQELVDIATPISAKVGPLHAMWDVILDAEAIIAGRPLITSEEETRRSLEEFTRSHD